jgi:hypothetical protein
MFFTRNGALGGSAARPASSMLNPVPVGKGAGGVTGCVCCKMEPAFGTTGSAA